MKITKIKALWPEGKDFRLERKDTGEEYIFIHLLTEAQLSIKEGVVTAQAGSCIFYAPHTYQYLAPVQESGLLHDWVHLTPDFDALFNRFDLQTNTLYHPKPDGFVTDVLQELELETLQTYANTEAFCEAKLTELLIKLQRNTERKTEFVPQALRDALLSARTYIHLHYSAPWTVESMANLVHVSSSYFYSVYKTVFGITPKADLQTIRLEHAKLLLLENRLSVKEIARLVGYENEFYFIKTFKSHTGITPGQYAKATLSHHQS